MRTRLMTALMIALLSLGAVACDDTADGVGTDAEQIEDNAGEAVEDAGEGIEDAGEAVEDAGEELDGEAGD